MAAVVLGYDTLEEYISNDGYLGATIGRFANRIKNAHFQLNGEEYPLYANDGGNHPQWPTPILRKGETFHSVTTYTFL